MKESITKYYCDRCGKEINKKYVFSDINTIPISRMQQLFDTEWINVDLCDDCKNSYIKWWRKGDKFAINIESSGNKK